jgi:hypothetical protein
LPCFFLLQFFSSSFSTQFFHLAKMEFVSELLDCWVWCGWSCAGVTTQVAIAGRQWYGRYIESGMEDTSSFNLSHMHSSSSADLNHSCRPRETLATFDLSCNCFLDVCE